MPALFNRRSLLLGAALFPVSRALAQADPDKIAGGQKRLAALEQKNDGRLGVAVLDTGSGARLSHRAGERFAMCSTFKFLAAAAILRQADDGIVSLSHKVPYGESDLLSYAPETRKHIAEGNMMLGALCAAAVKLSDNTAANLMLRQLGGPQGLTQYARTLGDQTTRLDRTEPTLNSAIPGDPRDTTTPETMLSDMNKLLLGTALSASSRDQLDTWMRQCRTGLKRLRAGLPPSWIVGDKTGTGDNNTANTIAIIRPPQRAPILAAVYYTGSTAPPDGLDSVHAEIGRMIAQAF
ncbi:MAG TPA: class A beta-lactamase [Pseudolabrys sp.]|nr:class A beta-lactamase [Pseudolabrys sp.]